MSVAIGRGAAARFFVAFYRLNHPAYQEKCLRSTLYSRSPLHCIPKPQSARSYFATTRYRQLEDGQILHDVEEQDENSSRQRHPVVDQSSNSEPHDAEHTSNARDAIKDEPVTTTSHSNVALDEMSDSIRHIMRHFTTCPVVITAAHTDPSTGQSVPLGLVVSSFNTVTLDPPHISFNIKYPSKTLDAIRAAKGLFRVHLLSASMKSAQIVDGFARGNTEETYLQRRRWFSVYLPQDPHDPNATPSLAPQIKSSSVVAALECELTQQAIVADHVVAIAKVTSLSTAPLLTACLTYRDGNYRMAGGSWLSSHSKSNGPSTPAFSPSNVVARERYWEYPLFPGKAEREDLVAVLKSHLQDHPTIFEDDTHEATRKLHGNLKLPTSPLGINTQRLIEECHPEGARARLISEHIPVLPEFYGSLGPSEIRSIVERAIKLVRAIPEAVDMRYRDFCDHLSISNWSTGLLASDILEPLRADGLIPPFQESGYLGLDTYAERSILGMEPVELELRKYFRTLRLSDLHRKDRIALQQAIRAPVMARDWISRVRDRLTIEEFPEIFNGPNIDIKGELTPEERRVVVHRLLTSLNVKNFNVFHKKIKFARMQLLRDAGIHPLVSNIDLDYIFLRLHHLAHSFTTPNRLIRDVDAMLAPIFDKGTLAWEDVEARVRALVARHALHVVRWPREDIIAALGIDQSARMKTPISANKPHIRDGNILSAIVAKELRARYGKGTPEENDAIKGFLKSQHNYDVELPSPALDPEAGAPDETLRQSLGVEVPDRQRAEMEFAEALQLFGRYSGGLGNPMLRKPVPDMKKGKDLGRKPEVGANGKSWTGWGWKKVEGIGMGAGEGKTDASDGAGSEVQEAPKEGGER